MLPKVGCTTFAPNSWLIALVKPIPRESLNGSSFLTINRIGCDIMFARPGLFGSTAQLLVLLFSPIPAKMRWLTAAQKSGDPGSANPPGLDDSWKAKMQVRYA